MDTAERVVESYVRYVKGWATISNLRCSGNSEIDLLAVDPVKLERYHIETSVSISEGFSKLTAKPFARADLGNSNRAPSARRTLGFFVEHKFAGRAVTDVLAEHGFESGNYHRVIVTWGWETGVEEQAAAAGVLLWDFRRLIQEIGAGCRDSQRHFPDDIIRTLHLHALAAATLPLEPK